MEHRADEREALIERVVELFPASEVNPETVRALDEGLYDRELGLGEVVSGPYDIRDLRGVPDGMFTVGKADVTRRLLGGHLLLLLGDTTVKSDYADPAPLVERTLDSLLTFTTVFEIPSSYFYENLFDLTVKQCVLIADILAFVADGDSTYAEDSRLALRKFWDAFRITNENREEYFGCH